MYRYHEQNVATSMQWESGAFPQVYSNQGVTLTTHSPPFSTESYKRLEAGCSASPLPSTMNRTEYQYDRIVTNKDRVKCFIIITGVIQKNLAAHLKTIFSSTFSTFPIW
jgi:hypothetical protein